MSFSTFIVAKSMSPQNIRIFTLIIACTYLLTALFGMAVLSMSSEHGAMMGGGCPLMRDTGLLCQTGILDHIAHWNMLFATTLALVVFLIIFFIKAYLPVRELLVTPAHERYRRYVKEHPHIRLFQTIVQEFSDGVIQPKIFA